jgi:site-specific DNA-methyltransferase (adenine-specific)
MNIWLAIDKKNWVDNRTGSIKEWVGSNNTLSMRNWLSESMEFKSEYEERKATNERAWWGTALKPSYEPIIVARKPLEWSCTDNVIKYGVGGINIDECRVGTDDKLVPSISWWSVWLWEKIKWHEYTPSDLGRFPANTILTYDESDFEEVCWWFPDTKSWSKMSFGSVRKAQPDNTYQLWFTKKENSWQTAPDNYWDSGNASRYFYCAKASKRDRDEGLDEFEESNSMCDRNLRKNTHPTVKPCDLMQYLVRLVTPNGWTVLDPFNWSGSTGKAVMYENKDRNKNYKYIWIELTEEYLPIAKARIEYVINKGIEKEKSEHKQEEQTKQRKESALF